VLATVLETLGLCGAAKRTSCLVVGGSTAGHPLVQLRPLQDMLIASKVEPFGDPPIPRLSFLRLRSPPPKVKDADIREVAKFQVDDQVAVQTNPVNGLAGLRSAEIQQVEFANPNYPPYPRTDDPEPLYLIKLDSTRTTYARTSPRWVREHQVHPRPVGVQWDAWQKAKLKWDRVWDINKEFKDLADKQLKANSKRVVDNTSRKLLQSLSAANLKALPVSRFTRLSDEDVQHMSERGIKPQVQHILGLRPTEEEEEMTMQRALSTNDLKHLQHRGLDLPPLRKPTTPSHRRRVPGSLRQRRVRSQIAPPTEQPKVIDSRRLNPWYLDSSSAPASEALRNDLQRERKKKAVVMVTSGISSSPAPPANQQFTKRADHAQQNLLIIP
jgi:hypothetical protein